jgi:hypothetical protein
MTNNENGITDWDRYNRYSEDWRFHHKLIWEIPSVASIVSTQTAASTPSGPEQ